MLRTIIFILSFALIGTCGVAQTREELEKQKREIQKEIEDLQRVQSSLSKDKKTSLGQLRLVQNKLKKRMAVINTINTQVRLIENDIFFNNREIYRLQKQIDTLKEQYAKTIEYAYKNRSSYDMLNFIFTASSFNDAVKRISYLKSYRNYRDEQVAAIYKARATLEGKVATLSSNKKEKSAALIEQSKQMKILEDEKKEKSTVLTKLQQREKELSKELSVKKRLERNLQNAIAAIVKREIAEARKKAEAEAKAKAKADAEAKKSATDNSSTAKSGSSAGSSKTTTAKTRTANVLENTPEVTRVSVGFENNRRNLPWPVEKARIVSGFGRRPIEGTKLIEDNIGITIATAEGSNVKAVFEGIVSSIYDVAGSQTVTIKHGKYFTTYYNLSTVSVSKGQEIKMGQVIGKAGVNDDGDGEILFVVNIESKFVDPEQWLK